MIYEIGCILTFLFCFTLGIMHHNKVQDRSPDDIFGYIIIAVMIGATSWLGLVSLIIYKVVGIYVPQEQPKKEKTII